MFSTQMSDLRKCQVASLLLSLIIDKQDDLELISLQRFALITFVWAMGIKAGDGKVGEAPPTRFHGAFTGSCLTGKTCS
jgi:hypothetical protein